MMPILSALAGRPLKVAQLSGSRSAVGQLIGVQQGMIDPA